MTKWPLVNERIRECLREAGYWKNDRPDVARFAKESGIHVMYIYKWLGNTIPSYANILDLAERFKVSPAWLMFGDLVPKKPSRRRHRKLAVLLALALLGASGMVPAEVEPHQDDWSNRSASYQKWLWMLAKAIGMWHRGFPGQGFPDLQFLAV